MESHRYKYSVVKMASRLDVSVRSYYDYRRGIYRKRSLQRVNNEHIVSKSFELLDGIFGIPHIGVNIQFTTELCLVAVHSDSHHNYYVPILLRFVSL